MDELQTIAAAVAAFDEALAERFAVAGSAYSQHVERIERDVNVARGELRAAVDDLAALKAATGGALAKVEAGLTAVRAEQAAVNVDLDERVRMLAASTGALQDRLDVAVEATESALTAVSERLNAADAATTALDERLRQVEGLVRLLTGTLAPSDAPAAAKPVRAGAKPKAGG